MSTDYISQWGTNTEGKPLTKESFVDMMDGKVPFIRIPQFVSQDATKMLGDNLLSEMVPYMYATGPALIKMGVAQFEFQAQAESDLQNRKDDMKERYFHEAEKSMNHHKRIEEISGVNIWQAVVDKLRATLPDFEIGVASEGPGKKYFSGILRGVNHSTPIHCDWAPYDASTEDWIVNRVTSQGTLNVYLTSFKGGRTEVHDVQWTHDALRYRDPESYGYFEGIVEGRAKATLRPEVGDIFMLNSRNMHKVFPLEKGDGSCKQPTGARQLRVTLSSFYGFLPTENEDEKPRLMLWS